MLKCLKKQTNDLEINSEMLLDAILDGNELEVFRILSPDVRPSLKKIHQNDLLAHVVIVENIQILEALLKAYPIGFSSKHKIKAVQTAALRNTSKATEAAIIILHTLSDSDAKDFANLGFAWEFADDLGNREIIEALKSTGVPPPIHQTVLLRHLSKWLQIDFEKDPTSYCPKFVSQIREKLYSSKGGTGHCSGFAWLHRIMFHRGEQDKYYEQMRAISEWDGTPGSLSLQLNTLFKTVLQIVVFAQAGDTLDLSISEMSPEDKRFFPEEQDEISILKTIAPDVDIAFSDYLHIHKENTFHYEKRNMVVLKDMIDDLSEHGAMIFLAIDRKHSGHALDIGKIKNNDNISYWLYDPNSPIGTQYFDTFNKFFDALKKVQKVSLKKAFIRAQLNAYLPPSPTPQFESNASSSTTIIARTKRTLPGHNSEQGDSHSVKRQRH